MGKFVVSFSFMIFLVDQLFFKLCDNLAKFLLVSLFGVPFMGQQAQFLLKEVGFVLQLLDFLSDRERVLVSI